MASRILVAEDISAHAKVMRCNLTTAGYDVTIATDGRQAWMATRREHFDLVITDNKMPYLTGIQLCRLLRQDRRYAQTPIILVTSYCEELDMHLVRSRLILSAILEKPIAAATLSKKVEECLMASGTAAV